MEVMQTQGERRKGDNGEEERCWAAYPRRQGRKVSFTMAFVSIDLIHS